MTKQLHTARMLSAWLVLSCAAVSSSSRAAADAPPAPLTAALAVGSGFGQRFVHVPLRSGEQRLESGFFPVLDLRVNAELGVSRRALLGAEGRYQTSVALQARAIPPAGVRREVAARSHHMDLGATAGLRFADSEASVRARLFAGWAFRGFRTVVDIDIPSYSLHGPVLRPELQIPIANGAVVLHVEPEIMFIVHATDELREAAATSSTGFAVGGEAALDIRLSERAAFTLAYRESRARVASAWSANLRDNERFFTARIALRY
jgi:hypothetical protein